MKKKITLLVMSLILVISTLALAGCSKKTETNEESNNVKQTQEENKKEKIKIAALKGPTGMGMVKLMEENKEDYDITIFSSPDEIIPKIINGEFDAAAVPSNLAAILYNKTKGGVKLTGINTLGVLHIVENGDEVKTIKDLKGKTIYSSGKGAVPEFVFNYILKKNGLEPNKDVKIEYKMQHSDLATALAAKKIKLAVLPEPFVTTVQMKDKDLKVQMDLTKEWEKVSNENNKLVMGTLIFRKDFIDKREKDVDEFLDKYKKSVDFVNSNNKEAGKLIAKNGILPKAEIGEKAIPKCNIVFISAKDGKSSLENFYSILKESNPKSIGGNIPDEDFYYKAK